MLPGILCVGFPGINQLRRVFLHCPILPASGLSCIPRYEISASGSSARVPMHRFAHPVLFLTKAQSRLVLRQVPVMCRQIPVHWSIGLTVWLSPQGAYRCLGSLRHYSSRFLVFYCIEPFSRLPLPQSMFTHYSASQSVCRAVFRASVWFPYAALFRDCFPFLWPRGRLNTPFLL